MVCPAGGAALRSLTHTTSPRRPAAPAADMSAFGSFGTAAVAAPSHNPNKDVEVSSPPTDGIAALSFSPTSNLLVAASWDNQVRCWDVQSNGQAVPKAATSHDQPVLCADWSADGSAVFSGARAGWGQRGGGAGWGEGGW